MFCRPLAPEAIPPPGSEATPPLSVRERRSHVALEPLRSTFVLNTVLWFLSDSLSLRPNRGGVEPLFKRVLPERTASAVPPSSQKGRFILKSSRRNPPRPDAFKWLSPLSRSNVEDVNSVCVSAAGPPRRLRSAEEHLLRQRPRQQDRHQELRRRSRARPVAEENPRPGPHGHHHRFVGRRGVRLRFEGDERRSWDTVGGGVRYHSDGRRRRIPECRKFLCGSAHRQNPLVLGVVPSSQGFTHFFHERFFVVVRGQSVCPDCRRREAHTFLLLPLILLSAFPSPVWTLLPSLCETKAT